jgi:hypothetical protein
MNIKENHSLWQYLEFLEICPSEHFLKIDPKELEDHVKCKSDQRQSCGEFQVVRFRVKNCLKQSPDAPDRPRFQKGTEAVSGFQMLVTWLTQTLAI